VSDSSLRALEISPRAVFLKHCEEGQLAYQVSCKNGLAFFYPRVVQPQTGNTDLEWSISGGLGRVYATTTVRHRGAEPHNVSMIEMDEGFRLMSTVKDVNPDEVRVGMRVRVEMDRFGPEGTMLPTFVSTEEDND
jgi:uncharacterized OB-fold protein